MNNDSLSIGSDSQEENENSRNVMYKPLPESLTIKQSDINGLGLFADQKIMQATNLGMTHLKFNGTIFRKDEISIFFSLNFSVINAAVNGVANNLHLSSGHICATAPI